VKITEDPATSVLLEYMATPIENWVVNPASVKEWSDDDFRAAGWIVTDDLTDVIEEATGYGNTKARSLLNRAFSTKLVDRHSNNGQGKAYKRFWRITDLGRLWLREDEEDSIHGWFETDRRKTAKRVTNRPTKPQPPAPRALPMPKAELPKVGK
jgi:hypothetical protein